MAVPWSDWGWLFGRISADSAKANSKFWISRQEYQEVGAGTPGLLTARACRRPVRVCSLGHRKFEIGGEAGCYGSSWRSIVLKRVYRCCPDLCLRCSKTSPGPTPKAREFASCHRAASHAIGQGWGHRTCAPRRPDSEETSWRPAPCVSIRLDRPGAVHRLIPTRLA